ncbi:hypothetical protein [Fructobacillus ficulneus]|uniref:Uncharacterized protein n=1 Tax=Fructobacillus ficulneus TaxID=157463 RepID=A0A0K8MF89_9LACO|nr:hypothetical protein [Fructobacillus ficulneus]GAO99185.1 hypothetical protein FFIC_090070 [Fructobacillus ficulneus]
MITNTRKERIHKALLAAQQGDEEAYSLLYDDLKGLSFKIYFNFLHGSYRSDDWESDALEVLLRCVQHYDCQNNRALFSTYYMTALHHKAVDRLREMYSRNKRIEQKMLYYNGLDAPCIDIRTENYNPEEIAITRAAIEEMAIPKNADYRKVVAFLIGQGPKLHQPGAQTEPVIRVSYRFKKLLLKHLRQH